MILLHSSSILWRSPRAMLWNRDISRRSPRAMLWNRDISRNKEFIQFLFIVCPVKYTLLRLLHGAGGSAAEVQSQLFTALDQEYISQGEFDSIYEMLEVVAKQLSRLITYLKGSG